MTARLLVLLERRGIAAAPVLAAAATTRDAVDAAALRVPYTVVDRLVEAIADVLGEAGLGAEIAAIRDADTYDAAGHVLVASPTFGEGLRRSLAYQRLWGDGARFSLEEPRGGTFAVSFRHPGKSERATRILTETAFCEVLGAARMLADPAAQPREVHVAAPPPAELGAAIALFGIAPSFGAPESRLVLDASLFDAKIVLPEGVLAAMAERAAGEALRALPERGDLVARVVAAIGDRPDAFEASLDDVAHRLHTSVRTLQRRLAEEGTRFDAIVDHARRRRHAVLQARGASVKEIVVWLGFRDTSALRRARARWRRDAGG